MTRRTANRRLRGIAFSAVLASAVACFRVPSSAEPPPHLAALAGALPKALDVAWANDRAFAAPLPATIGGVLLLGDKAHAFGTGPDEAARESLRAFVLAGGRLVLFGDACRLVVDLGIEAERPVATTFRWGFDARAVRGDARLGFQVVSGQHPELFETLPPSDIGEDVYLLAGGAPCEVALCTWAAAPPRTGLSLARLAVQRDGTNDALGAPVVVHWSVGKGEVLACGLVPGLAHDDAAVRAAASAFVQRCSEWAGGKRQLLVRGEAPPAPPTAPPAMPRTMPLLAHWGWRLPQATDGLERTQDEVLREALLPSWAAGATLLELELATRDGGVPIDWPSGDPLQPAPSFESRPAQRWQASAFRQLAAEAHGRGMLVFGSLDPLPVGPRAVERLATLRFLSRELACVRRFGDAGFDGFGLRAFAPDSTGFALAMLQDFQPAGVLYRVGEQAAPVVGALRALDAEDGVVRPLPFAGVSGQWRAGFSAADFPLGVLDAGGRDRASGQAGNADWLVTQANDFVRGRAGCGAAMWWRSHDPVALPRDTLAYVHGLGVEPLRAAVAMPLSSTGSDGLRAAGGSLVPGLPATFGAHVPAPAAVHVLQNNWFRLLGSGGAFDFDPRGEADFGAGALRLSPGLLRTRLFGGRPDGNAVRSVRLDFLAAGQRGEGGYGETVRIGGGAASDVLPPAVLQRGVVPTWPGAVQFDWQADVGYHELDLLPRPVRGRGVLTVSLDGVLLRAVPFDELRQAAVTVPVHIARAGSRCLELAVQDGGALALDRLVMHRAGDVGVEANVTVPAGSLASLCETSQSSYHKEQLELTTIADFPGFVLATRCDRAVRNLQLERVLSWPSHRELVGPAAATAGEPLTQPFVLRGQDARLPDLVVVPLQHARYETLRWQDGELIWKSAPESGAVGRLGVLCCRHGEGPRWLAAAPAMLSAIAAPLLLPLGEGGAATLVCEQSMPFPRVLQVPGDGMTPFLVCEQGSWSMRAGQAGRDGVWLRVLESPGDTVQIRGGAAVLAGVHPGPGSASLVQWRDLAAGAVTVRVVQPSCLTTPSLTMAADFDECWLDGQPWAHFDGRTVHLPNRSGTWRLTTRDRAGGPLPHVRSCRAPLSTCSYDAAAKVLVLATPGDTLRPAELPWTAVLGGGVPRSIENGEIVDDATLRHPDAAAAAAARAGGVLIRFRNGTCKVHYGE